MKSERRSVVSDSLRPHGLYNRWDSPGQNTGVGSLSLLQGIFPIQRSTQVSHRSTQVSHIAGGSLPAEPQGKPKNTGGLSLSIPSPAALPDPGIKPGSPSLQADLFQLAIREDRRGLPIWGIRAGMTNFHAAKEECLG